MSTCSISIIPKTKEVSVSAWVAKCLKVLDDFPDLKYTLTAMSTQIEGPTDRLFEAIRAMHEAPFKDGVKRVYTVVHLDDRRDKELTLDGKVTSVQKKL
ncbi:hypothetical protein CEE37_12505 [candidate division LCP-89 bacterium B3_LCP]|uniref:Thiamine-binding protein domain-containing protein n=1 Tax=candidate division LCP-89 bacterium B3_LCP TaxID=2012998 RepID=A0A532UUF3_UNCL8|nr:MAG: hypothetical protein CEE37_12505 [candidate division LCP-89 bacterium B3_LCP]